MPARVRLVLAVLVCLAWTGWLLYEVARSADPIVVSRPQVMAAPVVVEANVDDRDGGPARQVEIVRVLRGRDLVAQPGQGPKQLDVAFGVVRGWRGAGPYFLCLEPDGPGYRVASPPLSPGFNPKGDDALPMIYPVTDSTRAQLAQALGRLGPPAQ